MPGVVCFDFRDSGECSFGADCRFIHEGQQTRGSITKTTQLCYSFRDGNCDRGEECRFAHDLTVESKAPTPQPRGGGGGGGGAGTGRARRRRGRGGAGGTAPSSVPVPSASRKNDRLECHNWRETGDCDYGSRCRFLHDDQPTRGASRKITEICYTFRDEGECKFGDGCRYSHDMTAAEANTTSAPKPRPRQVCYNFRDSNTCEYGDRCRFSHDVNEVDGVGEEEYAEDA